MTQEKIEKLYETCYMRVFSYAMTQETFFRAFSKQSEFRGESDEVTWLCAIAKNYWLDEKRRGKRTEAMPEEMTDLGSGPEQAAVDRDSSFRIHMALHQLEEPYREVFTLRTFCDLSHAQIAGLFGKSEAWSRVTYYRARQMLQDAMKENENEKE